MIYYDNDYNKIENLLKDKKIIKSVISNLKVELFLEDGKVVTILHETYEGLDIKAYQD